MKPDRRGRFPVGLLQWTAVFVTQSALWWPPGCDYARGTFLGPVSPWLAHSLLALQACCQVLYEVGRRMDPGMVANARLLQHDSRRPHCPTCRLEKPLRSKHCTACDHCVLRFDHHCPWFGCCVGKENLRVYVVFLVIQETVAISLLLVFGYRWLGLVSYDSLSRLAVEGLAFFTSLAAVGPVTYLVATQLRGAFLNITTNERHNAARFRYVRNRSLDRGPLLNLWLFATAYNAEAPRWFENGEPGRQRLTTPP
jgi:DHHC palmitoyltransferase